eukprot:SAG31_NODE_7_length_42755_cov_130.245728_9_plen_98_part_00
MQFEVISPLNAATACASLLSDCLAKEKIVGWYSTGPKIKPVDIQINNLFRSLGSLGAAADPVFVIIDVNVKADVLPTDGYVAVEETMDVRSLTALCG